MSDVATSDAPTIVGGRLLGWVRDPWRALPVAAVLLAIALTVVVALMGGLHIDLEVYRFAVWELLGGGDLYGPLPPTALAISLPFIYPPFAALVLMPFALVPWGVAWTSLLALSTLAIGITLYVTARRVWPSCGRGGALSVAALALPFTFVLEPVRENIYFGQINLLLMVLVAVDCLVARPRWPRGMLVGLAAAIKLTPAAFVLFFLLRGDRRAAVVAAVTGVAATLVSFAVLPEASVRFWLHNPAGVVSGAPFFTNQTFEAVLVRAGIEGPLRPALWLLLSAGLLALAVPAIRRAPAPLALVATAGVALLISPTSWSHHWVWVVPALLVAATTALRTGSRAWIAAAVAMAFVYVAAPHTWGLPRADSRELLWTPLQQFVGATFVWFTVLLYIALFVRWRRRAAQPAATG